MLTWSSTLHKQQQPLADKSELTIEKSSNTASATQHEKASSPHHTEELRAPLFSEHASSACLTIYDMRSTIHAQWTRTFPGQLASHYLDIQFVDFCNVKDATPEYLVSKLSGDVKWK